MSEERVVSVRGLREAHRDRVVVDGLDLDIAPGEAAGLAGASGAGTTATVSMPDPSPLLLASLATLEGARNVDAANGLVTVDGDRRMIAHAGARLVLWGPAPPGSSARAPSSSDALLALLDSTPDPHVVVADSD
jgi:ABC-type phosphonate transport system ATPase subunit